MSFLLEFISELRRRAVIKFAAIYAALAWVVLQFIDLAFPRLGFPDWTITFVLLIAAIGFPFGLIFAWIFERTPDGLKITAPLNNPEKETLKSSGKMGDVAVVSVLTVLVGLLYLNQFLDIDEPDVATVDIVATTSSEVDAQADVMDSPSIAVLPFTNLSALQENAYFAAGIHEDVLTQLSRIEGLKVISRTSMMRYAGDTQKSIREIAQELDVNHVLEGSVRRAGDQVRITFQLIEAATDKHIWAQNYDRSLENIFAVQTEVASAVALQLQGKLSFHPGQVVVAGPSTSAAIYDQYLKARELSDFWRDPKVAVPMLRQVIDDDPGFSEAYATLAKALMGTRETGAQWADIREEVFRSARRAVELTPLLDHGHRQLGYAYTLDNRYEDAQTSFLTALSLNPTNAETYEGLAKVKRDQGLHAESILYLEKSLEFDPLNAKTLTDLGFSIANIDPERALPLLEKARDLNPEMPQIYAVIGNVALATGGLEKFYDNWRLAIDVGKMEQLFPLNIMSFFLGSIGGGDLANRYLDEMKAISPKHSLTYASLLLNDLNTSQLKDRYSKKHLALCEAWVEHDSDSILARRYLADALRAQAYRAKQDENLKLAAELNQQANEQYEMALEGFRRPDGTYSYANPMGFGVIHFGLNLLETGDAVRGRLILDGALTQIEADPVFPFLHIHRFAVYASLAKDEAALDALEDGYKNGLYSAWVVESYVDRWFPRFVKNVRYQRIMHQIEARNAKALVYIRLRESLI